MRKALVAMVSGALLLSGCASFSEPRRGSELVGRSLRLVPAQGQPSTLTFGDGTVTSTFGQRSASGQWRVTRRELCFLWAGNFEECWPYTAPFQRGRTVPIRSSRGNLVNVTLL